MVMAFRSAAAALRELEFFGLADVESGDRFRVRGDSLWRAQRHQSPAMSSRARP